MAKLKQSPKSPHSSKLLDNVEHQELAAWVAAECDGYSDVKVSGNSYEGTKGGKKPIPVYRNDWREVDRVAKANLAVTEKLVVYQNGQPVSLDKCSANTLDVALRSLVLASLNKKGAL